MIPDDDFEKTYRPSATIIIASRSMVKEQGYDYRVLLTKRTPQTAYAPDHFVFPGGVFDAKADESIEWIEHFQQFGITSRDLDKLSLEYMPNRPRPLMTNKRHFSRDISLRITAIREAFEEVGMLLCVTRDQLENKHKGGGTFDQKFNRSYWQEKIHNNSLEFINLCKYLDVVPDIWSLQEWSIWRSPPAALKKYDTVLYLVTLKDQPELLLEPSEVERELWISPLLSLKLYKEQHIWLAPLQFYELSRLSNILSWNKLKDFVLERCTKGSTLLMLAYYRCDDCLVGTLPNDDYYPDTALNHTETITLQGSSSDFEAKTKNLHRLIYRDMYDISLVCNTPALDHHLGPVQRIMNDIEISKL